MPRASAFSVCAAALTLFVTRDAIAQIRIDRGGSSWAQLDDNGSVYLGGSRVGEISSSGTVYVNGSSIGEVSSSGSVYLRGSRVAEVSSNGTVYVAGSSVGEVSSTGRIYARGSSWGSASNCCSSVDARRVAAVLLFFPGGAFELSRATATSMTVYRSGASWARVEEDGDVYIQGSASGRVEEDGDVYVRGDYVGRIEDDGDIYHRGNSVGRVEADGDLYLRGTSVGRIEDDGDIYVAGSSWGRATECCASRLSRPRVAALLYFFAGGAFELESPMVGADGGGVSLSDASLPPRDAGPRADASVRVTPRAIQCSCSAVGTRSLRTEALTAATIALAITVAKRRPARR